MNQQDTTKPSASTAPMPSQELLAEIEKGLAGICSSLENDLSTSENSRKRRNKKRNAKMEDTIKRLASQLPTEGNSQQFFQDIGQNFNGQNSTSSSTGGIPMTDDDIIAD